MSHNRLALMPEDVLCKIFVFFSVKDIPVLLLLSKELSKIANSKFIIGKLIANSNNIPYQLSDNNVDQWIRLYRDRKNIQEIKAQELSVTISGDFFEMLDVGERAFVNGGKPMHLPDPRPSLPDTTVSCIISKKTILTGIAGSTGGSLLAGGLLSIFSKTACIVGGISGGLIGGVLGCVMHSKQLRNKVRLFGDSERDRLASLSVPLIESKFGQGSEP